MNRSFCSWLAMSSLPLLVACGGAATAQPCAATAAPPQSDAHVMAELPSPGSYALDPPHTFVGFSAQHKIVGRVRGRFDKVTGVITVDKDPAACAVDVTIEAPSVSTQNTMRDDDLRSPAFFDAAKSPTITYRGKGIRRAGNGWVIDGSLTIRGVTKVLPLTFEFKGVAAPQAGKPDRVSFHATGGTKRADFGMVRELADELGPNPQGLDVTIEIDAEALATK